MQETSIAKYDQSKQKGQGRKAAFRSHGAGEDKWRPLAFIFISVSATEDTESWGKAVANKCVEIFVPVKWNHCLPT